MSTAYKIQIDGLNYLTFQIVGWVDPGSELALFCGHGYTGHEHLPWFKLINMPVRRSLGRGGNGRVYDPLTGQFLSPDNYVQAPGFTQSYNRYSYCLNNPLKYTDPNGEGWGFWILGGITGGIWNVVNNWENIDNFGEGFAYFNVGGLAGSSGAVLADLGVEAPGIGMACNWMLETGNALIEGASGSEVMERGTQSALWGGASGFAVMGLNAGINGLLNMPINVKTGSGLIEPYTHRPERAQISLGDWIFGSQNSHIGEVIATQGTANATVVLAAAQSSTINVSSLPRSTPQPMYMNSNLSFSGQLIDYSRGRQYVEGLLMWVNNYSDGSISVMDSWSAISGPWQNPIATGGHTIQYGYMGRNTGLPSYQRNGADFYINIFPNKRYEIHPDGNTWGTNGCIGVRDSGARLNYLYDLIQSYARRNNVLQLHINY